MRDGSLGRFQYLSDLNWTPKEYILDYETGKRYYPSNNLDMEVLVEFLNHQDKKIVKLERDYNVGVESKLFSRRQLEKDNEKLKLDLKKLEAIVESQININAELDALISYYDGIIKQYHDLDYAANNIKEYSYKLTILKELKGEINKRK